MPTGIAKQGQKRSWNDKMVVVLADVWSKTKSVQACIVAFPEFTPEQVNDKLIKLGIVERPKRNAGGVVTRLMQLEKRVTDLEELITRPQNGVKYNGG